MVTRLTLTAGNEGLDVRTVRTTKIPARTPPAARVPEKTATLLGSGLNDSYLTEACEVLLNHVSDQGSDVSEEVSAFAVGERDFSLEAVGTPRARARKGGYPVADVRLVLAGKKGAGRESPEILELARRLKLKKGFFADGKTAAFAARIATVFQEAPEALDPNWLRGLVSKRLAIAGILASGTKK